MSVATSPPSDDAYILAVSRTLAARGEKIKFRETEATEAGFKITVAILPIDDDPPWGEITRTASTTVLLRHDIANGRRMALEQLMSVEIEDHAP